MTDYHNQVTRPVVRYHGGKWRLAPWIIEHLPPHRVYVEAFGGGGSVLLRKPRSYAEVYNDLDSEMVNLFRVVRENGAALVDALRLTPFSRSEFAEAWHPSANPLEQARRTIIRSFMGFGSSAITMARLPTKGAPGGVQKTGFRANSNRSGTTPAHDWANYPNALIAVIERMQGVVIENRDAFSLIPQHDGPDTLFYIDPPYLASTRDKGLDYRHEMTDQDHVELGRLLGSLAGMVVISGYPSDAYNEIYSGWLRIDRKAMADGARPRIECLWLNKAAHQSLPQLRMAI